MKTSSLRLRKVFSAFQAYSSADITSEMHYLRAGELFVVLEESTGWWKVLTASGVRFVWFPEFELSRTLE